MVKDISSNANGFTTVSYTLTALPIIPYLKLYGFASDGITWDDIEPATFDLGADGLATINQKPVLYSGTFSLKPNSNSRNFLDDLVIISTPVFGKTLISYDLVLTEKNNLTGYSYVYSGGTITSVQAGNNNNEDDGQGSKTYKITFTNKAPLPL